MNLKLEKKVILVTGGSKGIGKAIVLDLLKEGAYVAACAGNGQPTRRKDGGFHLKDLEKPQRLHLWCCCCFHRCLPILQAVRLT